LRLYAKSLARLRITFAVEGSFAAVGVDYPDFADVDCLVAVAVDAFDFRFADSIVVD